LEEKATELQTKVDTHVQQLSSMLCLQANVAAQGARTLNEIRCVLKDFRVIREYCHGREDLAEGLGRSAIDALRDVGIEVSEYEAVAGIQSFDVETLTVQERGDALARYG
jgi:hypothetical protein